VQERAARPAVLSSGASGNDATFLETGIAISSRMGASIILNGYWMTYRQAQGQGWQVRAGEKGTQIQHWIWEGFWCNSR